MPDTPRPWRWTQAGATRTLELEPPGFVAFYKVAAWLMVVCGALVVPLALLGVAGALAFDDFPLWLRVGMGLAGGATTAAVGWLVFKLLEGALVLRTRVTITPAGVLIETGVAAPNKSTWLSSLETVQASEPESDDLERGGVVLGSAETTARIAVGVRKRDRAVLLAELQAGLRSVEPGAHDVPTRRPLGPSWSARTRQLALDIASPLRRPTPYLLVDVGAILGTAALTWLLDEVIDWRDAYPIAFGIFAIGLGARWFDGSYIAGLRHYLKGNPAWSMRYLLASLLIAVAAGGAMSPRLSPSPAFLIALASSVGLHIAMLVRAKGDVTPAPHRGLDIALALSLVPISVLHETAMFNFVVGSTKNLGVLSLTFVPVTVLVAYVPVRLHAFVDNPGDRSNVAWFWLTTIWLAVGPVIATARAIARGL